MKPLERERLHFGGRSASATDGLNPQNLERSAHETDQKRRKNRASILRWGDYEHPSDSLSAAGSNTGTR